MMLEKDELLARIEQEINDLFARREAVLASLSVFSLRVASLGRFIVSKARELLELQASIVSYKSLLDAEYEKYSEAKALLATIDEAIEKFAGLVAKEPEEEAEDDGEEDSGLVAEDSSAREVHKG